MSELLAYYREGAIEAGCDEAGRGCLAGPVYAAAVILPPAFEHPLLNDSKKLNEGQRNQAREVVEQQALAWAVARVEPKEIDEINILNASFLAMHRALDHLHLHPELLLIDGNRFRPYRKIPHRCIIKGDGRYRSIAAASILAKTHRDAYLCRMAESFPQYGWERNKGYPTLYHRQAIERCGPSPYHRRSFRLHFKFEQGRLF